MHPAVPVRYTYQTRDVLDMPTSICILRDVKSFISFLEKPLTAILVMGSQPIKRTKIPIIPFCWTNNKTPTQPFHSVTPVCSTPFLLLFHHHTEGKGTVALIHLCISDIDSPFIHVRFQTIFSLSSSNRPWIFFSLLAISPNFS